MDKNFFKDKNFIKSFLHVQKVAGTEDGKKKLRKEPKEVFKAGGFVFPQDVKVTFFENSPKALHLVIPRDPLDTSLQVHELSEELTYDEIARWIITQIQHNPTFKKKFLSNPAKFLKEHKIHLSPSVQIQIHENTPTMVYFVMPRVSAEGVPLHDTELTEVSGGAIYLLAAGGTRAQDKAHATRLYPEEVVGGSGEVDTAGTRGRLTPEYPFLSNTDFHSDEGERLSDTELKRVSAGRGDARGHVAADWTDSPSRFDEENQGTPGKAGSKQTKLGSGDKTISPENGFLY
jgi:hypothetical protein